MEEFKIIKLPTKDEDEEIVPEEQTIESENNDDDGQKRSKKTLIILIIILLVVAGFFVAKTITTYTEFETENSWERSDSLESKYLSFNNNVIKYSADGIFYTKYDGTLIWNFTFNMTNPNIDSCGDYIVIYDKKGTELYIFSSNGYIKTISCTNPIIDAQIAKQGTVSILLQENGVSYIQMYDIKGEVLVSGELHPENSGFPIAIALSSDATRLLVSAVVIDEGDLSTQLTFYDFTAEGRKREDNIVSKYTYVDMLISDVDYVKGDKALAFGDSKIIIFNNNTNATIAKEITITKDTKSVFFNDNYFGNVFEVIAEDGSVENQLNIYNLFGMRILSKSINDTYDEIKILDSKEVLIKDEGTVSIYNLQGFRKFNYEFKDNIYGVIPGNTARRYYIIEENKTEEIYIR